MPGDTGRERASLGRQRLRWTASAGSAGPDRWPLLALAALAPLAFSLSAHVLNDMVLAAAFVVMALGLNIVVGFAGQLDLGHVAFFAIGAYTAAYFASGYLLPDVLHSLPSTIGLDFDFSVIASGVYGAVIVLVMLLRPAGLVPAR